MGVPDKIKEIVGAWAASFSPTEEQKELAEERLVVCHGCEHNKLNVIHIRACELCGCPIQKKVFSPRGSDACPAKKWER